MYVRTDVDVITKTKIFRIRGFLPDSYPVAIYVFCGMRRLGKRMD